MKRLTCLVCALALGGCQRGTSSEAQRSDAVALAPASVPAPKDEASVATPSDPPTEQPDPAKDEQAADGGDGDGDGDGDGL